MITGLVARMLGIGRSTLYELIRAGRIGIIKFGSTTLEPAEAMEAFISAQRQRQ